MPFCLHKLVSKFIDFFLKQNLILFIKYFVNSTKFVTVLIKIISLNIFILKGEIKNEFFDDLKLHIFDKALKVIVDDYFNDSNFLDDKRQNDLCSLM